MNIFFQKNFKTKVFLLASFAFFAFLSFLPVNAFIASQVFIKEFNIQKDVFNAGEKIEGYFMVWNAEQSVVPDISCRLSLLAKDADGNFTVVWDEQQSGPIFSLNPDQTAVKNFSYALPKRLAPGEYEFRARLYNSKGTGMARKEIPLRIDKTEGGVLDIQKATFIKDGVKKGTEFYYYPNESPKISFEIKNNSFFTVKAYPKILIYADVATGNPIEEIKKDYVNLASGQSSTQEIELISRFDSSFYIARVFMYDQNADSVSNMAEFKWEVVNQGSAEIIQIETDKSSYLSGDNAKISIVTDSQGKESQTGDIIVKIIDNEKVIGEARQEADLSGGKTEIIVPLKKDVSNPKIETVILDKENKTLDQYSVKIKSEEENEEEGKDWLFVFGFVFAGLAIAIFVMLILMKRKNKKAGLAIFVFGFVFASFFLAGIQPVESAKGIGKWQEIDNIFNQDVYIFPSEPLPNSIFYLDGWATFSGNIDSLHFNKQESVFEFFIANSKEDAILKTEEIENSKIQIIDLDAMRKRGDKIESLGTAPMDSSRGYKAVLKIPKDEFYLGSNIRFYVQFKGLKETWFGSSWKSAIIYLEAIVQTNQEGGLYLDIQAQEAETSKAITSNSVVAAGDNIKYSISISNNAPCATIARPIDVVLALDRSGSMNYGIDSNVSVDSSLSRMAAAKTAIKKFLEILEPSRDLVGLISYSTGSSNDQILTRNYKSIEDALNKMPVNGGTCISCGINEAKKELARNGRLTASQYIILLTDGGANLSLSGAGSPGYDCHGPSALDAINQTSNNPGDFVFYTIGFSKFSAGLPPNNFCNNPPVIGRPDSCCGLMNAIAQKGGGVYAYAEGKDELVKIYEAIAGDMIGQSYNTKLTIDIPIGASVKKADSRCVFDDKTRKLECLNLGDRGFLDCNDKTKIEPVEIEVEIEDFIASGFEVKASLSNEIKEKSTSFKLIVSDSRVNADFSCNSSGCDIGCSDCCRCYNDASGVLILENKSSPESNIVESIWSVLGQGEKLRGFGIINYTPQKMPAGNHQVKLRIEGKTSSSEITKNVVFLQGAKAGFSCSADKGLTWHLCEDKDYINLDQGSAVWLSDSFGPEQSIISDGAAAGDVERTWYQVDQNGIKTSFNSGKGNSTVSVKLNRLPAIIGLELNDKNRPAVYIQHKINVIALPGWLEVSPF